MKKLFILLAVITLMMGCTKEPLPEPTYKLSFILMWNNKLYYNDVAYNTPYAVKNQKVSFICTTEDNEDIGTSGISNDEGKITFELPSKIRFFDISFMIPKGTVLVAPIVVDGDIVNVDLVFEKDVYFTLVSYREYNLNQAVVQRPNRYNIQYSTHTFILGITNQQQPVPKCFSSFTGYDLEADAYNTFSSLHIYYKI